jgi:hypothetical protein
MTRDKFLTTRIKALEYIGNQITNQLFEMRDLLRADYDSLRIELENLNNSNSRARGYLKGQMQATLRSLHLLSGVNFEAKTHKIQDINGNYFQSAITQELKQYDELTPVNVAIDGAGVKWVVKQWQHGPGKGKWYCLHTFEDISKTGFDHCVSCGKFDKICCDQGTYENGTSIDPVCVKCCKCVKHPIRDGKEVAGGVYNRCE